MTKIIKHINTLKHLLLVTFLILSLIADAQPVISNSTYNKIDPNGNSKSFQHTQNSGTDLVLYVIIQMKNQNNTYPTSVKFNNQSLTRQIYASNTYYVNSVWELINPDVGTYNVDISYNKGSYGAQAMTALSFTNCDGIGQTNVGVGGAGERTATLTAVVDSKIVAFGNSGGSEAATTFRVPNPTDANILWTGKNGNNKRYFGGISEPLSAGSQTFALQVATTSTDGKKVYPIAFEVKSVAPSCSIGTASSSPTACKGTSITDITHTTSGVTGITSSTGLPDGVVPTYNNDILTISGIPTQTGVFNYTIDLDGCDHDAIGTITIPDVPAPGGVCIDLTLWLDAQDIDADGISEGAGESGFTGGAITTWKDKSGKANDVTGTSGPSQILDILNYNPVLDFTSDYLTAPDDDQITADTDYTKFVVFSYDGASPNHTIGSVDNGGSSMYSNSTSTTLTVYNGSQLMTSGAILSPTTYYVASARYGAGDKTNILNINGNEIISNTTIQNHGTSNVRIGSLGSTELLDGKIAEAIVYDRALTDSEIDKVESYLAIKYGFTLDNTSGGSSGDYTSSDGSLLWDASLSPTYHNDVIAIGKDITELLYRKQSKTTDDSLRIFVDVLAASNGSNNGIITEDISYITIGNNKGRLRASMASNTEKPADITSRLERIWKVTNTNFVDSYTLEIEWMNLGDFDINDIRLLVDTDDNFSDATIFSTANGLIFSNGSILISGINTNHIPANSTRFLTIGSADAGTPLPIELLSFNAVMNHGVVDLNWVTATELRNDFFTVERSVDLNSFETVATINGAGNSSVALNYSHVDENPYDGVSYYRLKQTDYNGDFEYNAIRSVNMTPAATEFKVYPNPTSGLIIIEGLTDKKPNIAIYNVWGENVSYLIKKRTSNETRFSTDLSALPNGIYLLKIESSVFKLVKE